MYKGTTQGPARPSPPTMSQYTLYYEGSLSSSQASLSPSEGSHGSSTPNATQHPQPAQYGNHLHRNATEAQSLTHYAVYPPEASALFSTSTIHSTHPLYGKMDHGVYSNTATIEPASHGWQTRTDAQYVLAGAATHRSYMAAYPTAPKPPQILPTAERLPAMSHNYRPLEVYRNVPENTLPPPMPQQDSSRQPLKVCQCGRAFNS